MLIDQLVAVDYTAVQFANDKTADALRSSRAESTGTDGGFAEYLARITDKSQVDNRSSASAPADRPPDRPADHDDGQMVQTSADHHLKETSKAASAPDAGRSSEIRQGESATRSVNPDGTRKADEADRSEAAGKKSNFAETADSDKKAKHITEQKASAESFGRIAKSDTDGDELHELAKTVAASGQISHVNPLPEDGKTPKTEMVRATGGRSGITTVVNGSRATIEVVLADDARSGKGSGKKIGKTGTPSDGKKAAFGASDRVSAGRSGEAESEESRLKTPAASGRHRVVVEDRRVAGHVPAKAQGEVLAQGPESGDARDSLAKTEGTGSQQVRFEAADTPRHTSASPVRQTPTVLQTLRSSLGESLNGEIVRAARLVVRGQDTGEIRLHLKPENLGDVRITLRLSDGHISGRIIVENQNVRDVFEQNLGSLVNAFAESGLEAGDLDVLMSNSDGGNKSNSHASKAVVKQLEDAVPLLDFLEDDHELVDLVV